MSGDHRSPDKQLTKNMKLIPPESLKEGEKFRKFHEKDVAQMFRTDVSYCSDKSHIYIHPFTLNVVCGLPLEKYLIIKRKKRCMLGNSSNLCANVVSNHESFKIGKLCNTKSR